jgi:hypothetical protein
MSDLTESIPHPPATELGISETELFVMGNPLFTHYRGYSTNPMRLLPGG